MFAVKYEFASGPGDITETFELEVIQLDEDEVEIQRAFRDGDTKEDVEAWRWFQDNRLDDIQEAVLSLRPDEDGMMPGTAWLTEDTKDEITILKKEV